MTAMAELDYPAWSFSRIDAFELCPKKMYETIIAKNYVEPPSKETEWGTFLHKKFEDRIGKGVPLPKGIQKYEPLMQKIEALPGDKSVELKLAINKEFSPTKFFAKDAWLRAVGDVLAIDGDQAIILDYKIGKSPSMSGRPAKREQMELVAWCTFVHYPNIEYVHTRFLWLQDKTQSKFTFKRADSPEIAAGWMQKYRPYQLAFTHHKFNARPNGLCKRYCPVKSCIHNGG